MKITVVGAGAIGSLFGSMLYKSGQDVTLVDIWDEHVRTIQTQGLKVARQNTEEILHIKCTNKIQEVEPTDLIIMAVKSYDTEKAAVDCLAITKPNTIVLTVQNGVGNIGKIGQTLGFNPILAGTTAFGSTVLGPGEIKPTPTGSITLGELDGSISPRLQEVVQVFANAGIEMHISQKVESLIWTKLMVNVGINALTALTMLTNGQLLDYEEAKNLMALVVEEGISVAKAKGIDFLVEDPLQYVIDIAKSTTQNKSSMRQDIERGAKTEIDFINGAIVAEGQKVGVATPVNETLTKLIKTIEQRK